MYTKFKMLFKKLSRSYKFNSLNYWESRYSKGGNSGDGSYGRLSVYKSNFLNNFIRENNIINAIEMGCGDGHQLSTINYPKYIGIDVSKTIIKVCKQKFLGDTNKEFFVYEPDSFNLNTIIISDLALSLDVLYHIVEEKIYIKYLTDLFSLSSKWVIVYSTNFNSHETDHVLHRRFTDVTSGFSEWEMIQEFKNPYPGNGNQESMANFFIFRNKKLIMNKNIPTQ